MARQSFVLVVRQDLPARSVAELMQMAKANPGKLRMSSWGEGSAGHLALELLKSTSGADILHVPYKGAQAAMTDVLGGEVDMMITGYSTVGPHAKSGRLRVLAQTSLARSPLTPEIPTIAESGYPGYEVQTWYGHAAPANTPRAIVDSIQRAVAKAVVWLKRSALKLPTVEAFENRLALPVIAAECVWPLPVGVKRDPGAFPSIFRAGRSVAELVIVDAIIGMICGRQAVHLTVTFKRPALDLKKWKHERPAPPDQRRPAPP